MKKMILLLAMLIVGMTATAQEITKVEKPIWEHGAWGVTLNSDYLFLFQNRVGLSKTHIVDIRTFQLYSKEEALDFFIMARNLLEQEKSKKGDDLKVEYPGVTLYRYARSQKRISVLADNGSTILTEKTINGFIGALEKG